MGHKARCDRKLELNEREAGSFEADSSKLHYAGTLLTEGEEDQLQQCANDAERRAQAFHTLEWQTLQSSMCGVRLTRSHSMFTGRALGSSSRYATLRTQMFRAAMSIPTNIVEGRCQKSERDFARFLVTRSIPPRS